jgi:hypothetical protein
MIISSYGSQSTGSIGARAQSLCRPCANLAASMALRPSSTVCHIISTSCWQPRRYQGTILIRIHFLSSICLVSSLFRRGDISLVANPRYCQVSQHACQTSPRRTRRHWKSHSACSETSTKKELMSSSWSFWGAVSTSAEYSSRE